MERAWLLLGSCHCDAAWAPGVVDVILGPSTAWLVLLEPIEA